MATVAIGIVADNIVLFTFGKEPRGLPLPAGLGGSFQLLGIGVSPLQIAIPAVGLGLAAALHAFSRRTRLGKAMLAVVQNRDAASLMGINVERSGRRLPSRFQRHSPGRRASSSRRSTTFTPTWARSSASKAFAVAILGGITSAWGVMVAGLIFGVTEALITALLGSSYTQILSFALVIVVLALLPNGLFGRAAVKKV